MAGSQSSWLDRLLFGGIGLSLLVHALVLFGGHTTGPVAVPDAGAVEELQHGRSLKQLNLGGSGGLTGTLGNLQVCGVLGGLLECDASNGDYTVQGKLTITDGTRKIVIDPSTLTITTSAQRLNIGAVGNAHVLNVQNLKATGAVNLGPTTVAGTTSIAKATYVNGAIKAAGVKVAKTTTSPKSTCAGKPASG
ncbi:hypothetical protein ABPG77_004537 [Micractinium sp. CCAP 211/92]